jgi:hypothetical protein
MIDWITAVIPCNHDQSKLISGMVMSFDSQGNNEWVVNKQVTVEGSYSSKIQVKSHTSSRFGFQVIQLNFYRVIIFWNR